MSIITAPWNRMEDSTFISTPMTTKEAIVAARLDWEVETAPLYTIIENQDGGNHLADKKSKAFATIRSDNKEILGVVGQRYTPLQNIKAFEFFDPFIESGAATIETVGSLGRGRRVFILAKINSDPAEVITGDQIDKYILVANSHDGSLSVSAGFCPIRLACFNQLIWAIDQNSIKIRHTKNVERTLDIVQDIICVAERDFVQTVESYKRLAQVQMTSDSFEKYIKQVFVPNAKEDDEGTVGKRILNNVIPLFETGRGTDIRGVKGTAWGAYNAITEYLQHERGANPDIRLDQNWFGAGAKINQKAFIEAVQFAKAA